jgi:transcriptional regulator with XRE-family HTH domain
MTAMMRPSSDPPIKRYLEGRRGGPTVLRIVLGTQLRKLRTAAGITREAAGDSIRGSHAKISRIELGRVSSKERDISDLLTLYGVTDEEARADYLDLARQAGMPGWWQQYGDVLSPWFETLIGLEEAASLIRTYEVQFIPGLLQTEAYARAVTKLGFPTASEREIDRRVELRMARQKLLTRAEGPKLWAVVDEAALRRPLGGRAAMRAQLEHLLEISGRCNITVQVAPFNMGGLAAAGGPITILRFLEPDLPDIVYLEQLTSSLYLEKREDLDHYMSVMDRLSAQADTPKDSEQFLKQLITELD